ncbi:MAG: hypothetical protein IJ209_07980 [Bacteroidaceae bacterium]|nr:hypothetical protein [Bacteroidaceae bacterium]
MKIWRLAFAMLAAFSLASCSSDDDGKVSDADINRALFEMKKEYRGELQYGQKDEGSRKTEEGVVAQSAEGIRLTIPLEPIAAQVKDAAIAQKLREWQTADVFARYEFISVEDEYYSFRLRTEMYPDERFAEPITRTQPVQYGGLTLLFNQNYTGEYQKPLEALSFNICIAGILINREYVEGFKPIIFRYEGRGHTRIYTDE